MISSQTKGAENGLSAADARYVFVGGRVPVLRKLQALGGRITRLYVVPGSYLEDYCLRQGLDYVLLPSKQDFCSELAETEFDILVSAGCPYILPITKLQGISRKIFINLHGSLLPDLRGENPVQGAILKNRLHGASCHLMDDGIDTGAVIAQRAIDLTDDLSLELIYQLTYWLEGEVFEEAWQRGFRPLACQPEMQNPLYFTYVQDDMKIVATDSVETFLRKVRAFSLAGKYARLYQGGRECLIARAIRIENPLVREMLGADATDGVLLSYAEKKALIKWHGELIELETVEANSLQEGQIGPC